MALPQGVQHWSLTTLREKLIKIGAKVVRHGRYVTFQLAEVAIPYVTTVTMHRFFLLLGSRCCRNPYAGMETMWQQTVRTTIAGVMVWTVSVLAFAVAG